MTRDYRYGHKTNKPIERRTQRGQEAHTPTVDRRQMAKKTLGKRQLSAPAVEEKSDQLATTQSSTPSVKDER